MAATSAEPRHRDLIRQAKARWELAQRELIDPLAVRTFHPKQRDFMLNPARFRLFVGGNRSGKTTCLVAEIIHAALGFRPFLLKTTKHTLEIDPTTLPVRFRFCNGAGRPVVPPTRTLVVANGLDKGIGSVIIPKLRDWGGPYIEKDIKGGAGTIQGIMWRNGSRTDFGSYDQDPSKFEGTSYHAIAFDEPCPRSVWIPCRRALVDSLGRAWWALTPISEPWIFDELYTRAVEGDRDYYACDVTFFDNKFRQKDPEFIESLTDEEAEVRIYGRFRHLAGRVYKEFSRDVHLIEPFDIPEDWPRWHVVDPHDRKPFAMIWAAIAPDGTIYVYREWPDDRRYEQMRSSDMDIPAYAKLIAALEAKDYVTFRVMDPAFGRQVKAVHFLSLAEEFARYGIFFDTNVSNDIRQGHLKVKEYLAYDRKKPIGPLNKPRLFFFRNLRNMIWSLEHYIWDEGKRTGRGLREKPREIGKDHCDALRYLCMCEPRYAYARTWNRYAMPVGSYGEA